MSNFKKAVNELLGYEKPADEAEMPDQDETTYGYDEGQTAGEAPFSPDMQDTQNMQNYQSVQFDQSYSERAVPPSVDYSGQPFGRSVSTGRRESTIAEDMEVTGNISTKSDLNIHGRVAGNVVCGGNVVVTGSVSGDVSGSDITVSGSITGNVTVMGRAVLETGAYVKGDIIAKTVITDGTSEGELKVEETVIFKGSSVVTGNIYTTTFEVNSGAKVKGMIRTYD